MKKLKKKLDENKIFFFSEILDKKSKLRNYFEKSKKITELYLVIKIMKLTIKKIIQNKLKNLKVLNNEKILNIIIRNCNFDRDKIK